MRLLLCFMLAGCSTVPEVPAMQGDASVMCSLVSTFTTTVRTIYVQGIPDRSVSVSPDCAVSVK